MFLKTYLNVSDRQLLERYNTDWSLQYFFGRVFAENRQIKDMAIMTKIREYLEKHCEWTRLQGVHINQCKWNVNNNHMLLMDGAFYESYIRFSTNVKLFRECCDWAFEKQLFRL